MLHYDAHLHTETALTLYSLVSLGESCLRLLVLAAEYDTTRLEVNAGFRGFDNKENVDLYEWSEIED